MKNRNEQPDFNGSDERKSMKQEFQKEHDNNSNAFTKKDDLSLNNSIRNQGDVNGSTFGASSNPTQFSNIGQKDQTSEEENNGNIEDINQQDRNTGNGGSMYSDHLYHAENNFISGTGQFSDENRREETGNATKSSDAMQSNKGKDPGKKNKPAR